jgi:hypothetical protein
MFTLLAMLAAAPFATPTEPLAGQLRAAIWHDLGVNALIGNGNWVASLWYNAGSEDPKAADLHIQDLSCRSRTEGHLCSFTLFRDGGVKIVLGEQAADKLTCNATFVQTKDLEGWAVKHVPPTRMGHSQTTMRCKPTTA